MEIQGFFTKKGLALAAKLAAGQTLKITRAVAGAGETVQTASALSQIRQTLRVGRPMRRGNTAALPVTLAAGLAETAYTLREVGLYAQDPDEDEILYKVYRLSEPVGVSPDSRLVLRFYLEETVSEALNVTVACSPAGLITEADFAPVRDKVEATGVSSAETVHITAAELPGYIASLPRLLTKRITVMAAGGTAASTLDISGFYGPGRIWIQREGGTPLVLTKGAVVRWSAVQIILSGLTFRGEHAPESGGSFVEVYGSSPVSMNNCAVDGEGTGGWGILATEGSNLHLDGCTVQNTHGALLCQSGSVMSAENCAGSGNTMGADVYYGGLILLSGTTPNLMGGSANGKNGGLIASAAGTVL